MSLNKFLVKKDLVEVNVHYIESDDEVIVIRDSSSIKKFKDKIKIVKARFLRPTFKTFNAFMQGCVEFGENGENKFDNLKYKNQKFKTLLREIEDGGEVFPVDSDLLENIIPELATAFIDEYDQIVDTERFNALVKVGVLPEKMLKDVEKALQKNNEIKVPDLEEEEENQSNED